MFQLYTNLFVRRDEVNVSTIFLGRKKKLVLYKMEIRSRNSHHNTCAAIEKQDSVRKRRQEANNIKTLWRKIDPRSHENCKTNKQKNEVRTEIQHHEELKKETKLFRT